MAWSQVQAVPYGIHTSGTGGAGGGQVSGTSFTITFTSATAGNLLVAAWFASGDSVSNQTITNPSGWTLIETANENPTRGISKSYYKIAAGGETTVTFALGYAATGVGEVREYSGVYAASPLDKSAHSETTQPATTNAGVNATDMPTYQDGLHISFFCGIDTGTKVSQDGSINPIQFVLDGSTLGTESRNGTYTATNLTRCVMGANLTPGKEALHVSWRGTSSSFKNGGSHAIIFRGTSTANPAMPPATGTGGIRTATTLATATGTNRTLSKPSGTAAGDLLIAVIVCVVQTSTSPSGWTKWSSIHFDSADVRNPNTEAYMEIWYRVADGSEGASFVWTVVSGSATWGICEAFTGMTFSGTSWQGLTPTRYFSNGHYSNVAGSYGMSPRNEDGTHPWWWRVQGTGSSSGNGLDVVSFSIKLSDGDKIYCAAMFHRINAFNNTPTSWNRIGNPSGSSFHLTWDKYSGLQVTGGDHWGWAEGSDASDSWAFFL